MRRRSLLAVPAALAATASAGAPARAHARLRSASPAPESLLAIGPAEVSISFSEALEPRFSGLEVRGPDGATAMPGFAGRLDPVDIWALIDFVRARNAGTVFSATGAWPRPLPAPATSLRCAGGIVRDLDDLRGHPVAVALGDATPTEGCAAPDARDAYAVLTGRDPASLAGFSVVVDGSGWLRGVLPSDVAPGSAAEALCRAVNDPHAAPAHGPHAH